MKNLIIKYALWVIATTLLARLIAAIIMTGFPLVLNQINPDGSITTYPVALIEEGLQYLMNIVIIVVMFKDMKKQNLQSIPLLIVTFFFSYIGAIFFLLLSLHNKLTLKNK